MQIYIFFINKALKRKAAKRAYKLAFLPPRPQRLPPLRAFHLRPHAGKTEIGEWKTENKKVNLTYYFWRPLKIQNLIDLIK